MASENVAADLDRELAILAAKTAADPLAFVRVAFPWGKPGTELANETGPDTWQEDVLRQIGQGVLTPEKAVQLAIASGHGVGKSCLVSWIVLWAITTCPDTRGVATANTEGQLKGKTWPELARWHRLSLFRNWFTLTASAIFSADPVHERTWRIDQVAWSENNSEAFAGLHNAGKRILVVFDEASAVSDTIWETTEGALTDTGTEIIWLVAGNPTRNSGRFRECFGRLKHRWLTRQVDSRSVRITNKEQLNAWITDYGEDSDFCRVRIRGVFPRAGNLQFIDGDTVEAARTREVSVHLWDPFVIGCDIARQGNDQTVLYCRKGRDARAFPIIKMRSPDLMAIAAKIFDLATRHHADATFVDGGGIGAGVIDRLRQLRLPKLFEVQFGAASDRVPDADGGMIIRSANKRTEMWSSMREWLRAGAIPDDPELCEELCSPEFSHNSRDELILERKADMRRRGLASPDIADALALTFAYPVYPTPHAGGPQHALRPMVQHDYNPFLDPGAGYNPFDEPQQRPAYGGSY